MGFQANGNIIIDYFTTHIPLPLQKCLFFFAHWEYFILKNLKFPEGRRGLSCYSDLAFEIFNLKYCLLHVN